jgi:hypothetical protein
MPDGSQEPSVLPIGRTGPTFWRADLAPRSGTSGADVPLGGGTVKWDSLHPLSPLVRRFDGSGPFRKGEARPMASYQMAPTTIDAPPAPPVTIWGETESRSAPVMARDAHDAVGEVEKSDGQSASHCSR